MITLGIVINAIDITNAFFRPNVLSQILPNNIAPKGCIKNAAKCAPKLFINYNYFYEAGKHFALISNANNPYAAKTCLCVDVARQT